MGDDVYGEDPSINRLEEEVAGLLGKEAAVFTPSGSMANQIAIRLHTRPGDSVLCEEGSHTFAYEPAPGPALSGVQFDPHSVQREVVRRSRQEQVSSRWPARIAVHPHPGGEHPQPRPRPRPGAAGDATDRRHRAGPGAQDTLRRRQALERRRRHRRLRTRPRRGFRHGSGLLLEGPGGAGGLRLAGGREDVQAARKVRKRLGGGMRQAGFLAAAALYGVRQHRGRLSEDHRRAAALAQGLAELIHDGRPLEVDIPEPPTNMVYWRVDNGQDVIERLRRKGVLMNHVGNGWIRAVTHLQISDSDIHDAVLRIRDVLLVSGN